VSDLSFSGSDTATFEGDVIRRLEDQYGDDVPEIIKDWMDNHGSGLAKG
jgi:hypothetical protein